jgi:hypothetical protein
MLSLRGYLKEFKVWEPKASQTKGITRDNMPQVKSSDHEELLVFLKSKGIRLSKKTVKAKTLKATQKNFNKDKIVGAAANYGTLSKAKPIIVSKDNYIIDGHHRWLGSYNVGGDITILQANVKVDELLKAVREFPKTYTKNINQT